MSKQKANLFDCLISVFVWDYHFDPGTNVIDVHISRLRKKIDEASETPLLHGPTQPAGFVALAISALSAPPRRLASLP